MIRKANELDIDSILLLLKDVLEIHRQIRPDLFKKGTSKFDARELSYLLKNEDTPIFVYEDNEKVVGHLFLKIITREETRSSYSYKELFINDLVVNKQYRHKGIGKAFIEFAKKYGKEKGCKYVSLHAWEGNIDALIFYKKLGFTPRLYTLEEKL